jgi:hypothetical protein
MIRRKLLLAAAAVGFGLFVSVGPALAASSQARKDYPSNIVKVSPRHHKQGSIQPS